jgi:hypothetical protein
MAMVVVVVWMMAAGVIVIMIMVVRRMAVAVIMAERMFMTMTVLAARSVIMGVLTAVVMWLCAGLGLHIGAALGIERRLERDHPDPEPLGHRLDERIAADAQRLREHLGRQMAVAKVPSDADQRKHVGSPEFGERFRLGDHFDHASVLKAQPVATAQHRRFGEVEEELKPADARHSDASAIAFVEVEHHRVGWSARPMAGREDSVSA